MRNVISYLICAAFAALVVCSCSDRYGHEGVVSGHSFNVSFAEGTIADSLGLTWKDDIAVYGASEPLTVRKGKASGKVEDAQEYFAAYPYKAVTRFDPERHNEVVMTLPLVQIAVKGNIPAGTDLAVAQTSATDMSLEFENMLTYVRFTITEAVGKIRCISLISDSGSRLAGDFTVDCTSPGEVFPMPNSASNVVLRPSGEFFEPGEYYIAAFPSAYYESLSLAFEREDGLFARIPFSSTGNDLGGLIRDLGEIRLLEFRADDFLSVSSMYYTLYENGGLLRLGFYNDGEYELSVAKGDDWIEMVETRSVERNQAYFNVAPNPGKDRSGQIVLESSDGKSRLVYTIYQYGTPAAYDEDSQRAALIDLYNATNGDQWKNNDNWCSDLPISQWYGVTTYGEMYNTDSQVVYYLRLSNNDLSGTIPSTISALSGCHQIMLDGNLLEGRLPEEIFRFEFVYINHNLLESIERPADLENVMTGNLYLSGNRFSGELPEWLGELPGLQILNLASNGFSGSIPASYASFFDNEKQVNLNGNELLGPIPDEILSKPDFVHGWQAILSQRGEGFDTSDLRILAPNVYFHRSYDPGSGYTTNTMKYAEDLYSQNKYTLLMSWENVNDHDPELDLWYEAYHDKGFEILSYFRGSTSTYAKLELPWIWASTLSYYQRNSYYPLSKYEIGLIDSEGCFVVNPLTGTKEEIFAILEEEFGELPNKQDPEPDPLPEPAVMKLQEATEGAGIDIVLMGDAYSVEEIADGTYEFVMREAMEHFFDVEPFNTYRHLFNVHMVTVPSATSGYSDGAQTPLQCRYGDGNTVMGDDGACFRYASLAVSEERLDEVLVIAIMNSEQHGGTCYMYPPAGGESANGKAVAYIPKVKLKLSFRGLVQHEAGGHGFGKLADEYFEETGGSIPSEEVSEKRSREGYGWWANVDFSDDQEKVKWSHILSDPRYAEEGEGIYAGACGYAFGVWRPSYDSIMRTNDGSFNAPSREIIWHRIHKLAYGSEWTYDYEDFVRYDAINRKPQEW